MKMAGYSVGDRVEVRWQEESFEAKVVYVHSSDKVDVMYAIDGTVGVHLSTEKHGLKKKKAWWWIGCFNNVGGNSLCSAQRPKKPCTIAGCSTKAHAWGLCE